MEHPCQGCGTPVEDGVAFCQNCGAPQIRVGGIESPAPSTPPSLGESGVLSAAPAASSVAAGTGIHWSQALPAALLAGLIAALAMVVPLGIFGFAMLGAGFLSVLLYRRRRPDADVTPGAGARLGALSGGIGFGMFAVLASLSMLVFGSGSQLREILLRSLEQAAARNSDPQAQQILQQLKSPEGLALLVTLGLVLTLVVFIIVSAIGGAIGAALLRRNRG